MAAANTAESLPQRGAALRGTHQAVSRRKQARDVLVMTNVVSSAAGSPSSMWR
ncbi:hypothetical protein OK015_01740 [Mycobacterium sp. Aquia_216]|nr:hypothetical protein [Mycobacterium sp. Aquia_216]WAJ45273.1 hypothetical protein OK015_01740 [Mycobacterium sp. Aquia_216]